MEMWLLGYGDVCLAEKGAKTQKVPKLGGFWVNVYVSTCMFRI
jgi:hypothetical protein